MHIGLFVPCYVDQFYPGVAVATLRLLESLGHRVSFPAGQTCCGQPMANSGFERLSQPCFDRYVEAFRGYDCVVGPSGSCVLHLKDHLHYAPDPEAAAFLQKNTYELCEFLTDVAQLERLPSARFPHRVGLHTSCHGQRGLGLSSASELMVPPFSKPERLLSLVEGLELVPLSMADECCGFGGTFSVFEEALSVKMGNDRLEDHLSHGAEYITGGDMSCLMHLEGLARRQQRPVKIIHLAEILATGL